MTNWKKTACILCECNCGLEIQLGGDEGRHLVKLRGDKAHPSSQGYACEKAHRLDHYQHGADRLTSPLRRRADGTFEAIDWDTAIREVAQKLSAVRDTHGGESIFYYGGGGQGNHLCGAYSGATRRMLKARYRSSALAQEKTGEFWVGWRMMGSTTRADFEHCDVAMFLGKNPWFSHSLPRARVTLKEIAADPARTLIVVDPRRTETAELADIHLALKPGTDAWLLVAIIKILLEEDAIDHAFLAAHGADVELPAVRAAMAAFSLPDAIARTGLDEALVRRTARVIAGAKAFATFEDLGVQMNHHSTLVSYLHRVLILLTGSFGKPGTHFIPSVLINVMDGEAKRTSPVVGAMLVGGLVPCNSIADEILTDHPKRYRAMLVEASNPAHSLADSVRIREALASLECVVVIDVAMTETAKLAHYVLPAATQFEKAEATFFNFDFPRNYFHLRKRLFAPLANTLPEAEIHSRLVEALGGLDEAELAPLRAAAKEGMAAYARAVLALVIPNPKLSAIAPVVLYRTIDLPDESRDGAIMFGVFAKAAIENPAALARAGFVGSPLDVAVQLFEAMISSESGMVFAIDEWADTRKRARDPFHLQLPDLLEELAQLPAEAAHDAAFPFVLSAGERRSFTANTIIRDPEWRKKGADGALRINPEDASALGVSNGETVRLTTRRAAVLVSIEISESMQRGHISLPNGLGLTYPSGKRGVAPNELTSTDDRDPFVGTPWHKHVPARIERADPSQPAGELPLERRA